MFGRVLRRRLHVSFVGADGPFGGAAAEAVVRKTRRVSADSCIVDEGVWVMG